MYSNFSDDDVYAETVRDYSQAIGYHLGYVSNFRTMFGVLGIVVFGISIFLISTCLEIILVGK